MTLYLHDRQISLYLTRGRLFRLLRRCQKTRGDAFFVLLPQITIISVDKDTNLLKIGGIGLLYFLINKDMIISTPGLKYIDLTY